MLTAGIIQEHQSKPFHTWERSELLVIAVSSQSQWVDRLWNLDNPTFGQAEQVSRVDWSIGMFDGTNLLDIEYVDLLDWLRRFVWSVFSDPRDLRAPYKPGSALHISRGLHILVPWLVSKGRIIRAHQFRKTYAQFVLATEPSLLPAVQRQFHHVRMAMTERGYWGSNRIQVEPIDAMSSQLAAMQLYEIALGRVKVAGRQGVNLQKHIHSVKGLIESLSGEAGWRKVVRFVQDQGLQIWFTPLGNCMPLNREAMECHKVAGTKPLGRNVPNFLNRPPGLCAGCRCFIMDARHVGFWEDRYVANEAAYQKAVRRGVESHFRVAKERSTVAMKLLRRIDRFGDHLKARVQMELAHD